MRILIAGLGGIGQRHLRNILSLVGDSDEIIAVDPRKNIPVLTDNLQVESGVSFQKRYGLKIFPNIESGLTCKPDAVFICNPTSMHVPTAVQAVQAGSHVFIEKPLSHSHCNVENLVALAEKRGLVAVIGYQMRFHPCLKRLKSLIQARKVGAILSVRSEIGEYLPGWHSYEDYREMYASRKDLGGGVILSQIHEMDYLYWLFGLPRQVFALGGHLSSLELDVEDTAEILMEIREGDRSFPISLHVDYVQRPPRRGCIVIGDTGKIVLDFISSTIALYNGEGRQTESNSYPEFQRNDMFVEEVKWFFEAIHGQSTPLVNLREGMQSLRMALAAKESLSLGKLITLVR